MISKYLQISVLKITKMSCGICLEEPGAPLDYTQDWTSGIRLHKPNSSTLFLCFLPRQRRQLGYSRRHITWIVYFTRSFYRCNPHLHWYLLGPCVNLPWSLHWELHIIMWKVEKNKANKIANHLLYLYVTYMLFITNKQSWRYYLMLMYLSIMYIRQFSQVLR